MKSVSIGLAGTLLVAAPPVRADDLPHSVGHMKIGSRFYTVSRTYDGADAFQEAQSYTGPTDGFASASVNVPQSYVRAAGIGTACSLCEGGGQSEASIDYQFQVVSDGHGGPLILAPLTIRYNIHLETTGFAGAIGGISIGTPEDPAHYVDTQFTGPGYGRGNVDIDVTNIVLFDATVGEWNAIELFASGISSASVTFGSYIAGVDPLISLDPDFLAANPGYSLRFSIGATNGVPDGVPEPPSWALIVCGTLGAGAVLRARRRVAALA